MRFTATSISLSKKGSYSCARSPERNCRASASLVISRLIKSWAMIGWTCRALLNLTCKCGLSGFVDQRFVVSKGLICHMVTWSHGHMVTWSQEKPKYLCPCDFVTCDP